jgi:hypothetical protein
VSERESNVNKLVGRSGVVRAPVSSWVYDRFEGCPRGSKVLLLTESGIAIIGHIADSTKGYMAWAPLPDRDPEKEMALRSTL